MRLRDKKLVKQWSTVQVSHASDQCWKLYLGWDKKQDICSRLLFLRAKAALTKQYHHQLHQASDIQDTDSTGPHIWSRIMDNNQRSLRVFERRFLWCIYGIVRMGEEMRKRSNQELYRLTQEPDVMSVLRLARLRWAGHITWMPNDTIPKKVMLEEFHGKTEIEMGRDGVTHDARLEWGTAEQQPRTRTTGGSWFWGPRLRKEFLEPETRRQRPGQLAKVDTWVEESLNSRYPDHQNILF